VTNLRQPRQINKRQAEDVRRVDFEVDGLSVDALVVSCNSRRLGFNLALDLAKVVEFAPRDVEELAPFLLAGYTRWGMWDVDLVVLVGIFAFAGKIDELENKRPSCYDAATSGEKVSADNIFEHR
jgi:hypothetical protein